MVLALTLVVWLAVVPVLLAVALALVLVARALRRQQVRRLILRARCARRLRYQPVT